MQVGQTEFRTFGEIVFDVGAGEVVRDDERRRLSPKDARVLDVLTRNAGRVVTRDDLLREVWDGATVAAKDAMNSAIFRLRTALGDSASEPAYIETLHGRGYRFIQPVTTERPRVQASGASTLLMLPTEVLFENDASFGRALGSELASALSAGLNGQVQVVPFPRDGVMGVLRSFDRFSSALYLATQLSKDGPVSRLVVQLSAVGRRELIWGAVVQVEADGRLEAQARLAAEACDRIVEALGSFRESSD